MALIIQTRRKKLIEFKSYSQRFAFQERKSINKNKMFSNVNNNQEINATHEINNNNDQ